MLYHASDYRFLDVADVADRINGNILPIVNPTSPTAQLYFENYLFFLEAYYERTYLEQEGENALSIPVRTLNGANIYALNLNSNSLSSSNDTIRGPQIGYGNEYTYWLSPDTTYPTSHVNTYSEDRYYQVQNYLRNYQNPCIELKAPYMAMRPFYNPSRLLSEFVRVKFWEFHFMRKLLIRLRGGDWATKIVHQSLNQNGSVNYEYDESLGNTTFSNVRTYSDGSDGQGHLVEYQSARTVVTYKPAFFTFPYAVSASLIWKCSVQTKGSSTSQTIKGVWSTKSLNVSNGKIYVPPNMVETLCNDACDISFRDRNSSISMNPFFLLVDFEFPARLDGVYWTWRPSYS